MSDLQILAITRFAYPGLGGFQTEHDTVEARQAYLWHPDRMETRFRTLEHVCLRTLAAQTDGDFRTIVMTGDALPEPWTGHPRCSSDTTTMTVWGVGSWRGRAKPLPMCDPFGSGTSG